LRCEAEDTKCVSELLRSVEPDVAGMPDLMPLQEREYGVLDDAVHPAAQEVDTVAQRQEIRCRHEAYATLPQNSIRLRKGVQRIHIEVLDDLAEHDGVGGSGFNRIVADLQIEGARVDTDCRHALPKRLFADDVTRLTAVKAVLNGQAAIGIFIECEDAISSVVQSPGEVARRGARIDHQASGPALGAQQTQRGMMTAQQHGERVSKPGTAPDVPGLPACR